MGLRLGLVGGQGASDPVGGAYGRRWERALQHNELRTGFERATGRIAAELTKVIKYSSNEQVTNPMGVILMKNLSKASAEPKLL